MEIFSGEDETMNLFQMIVVPFVLLCFLWCAWKCVRGPGRYARMVNGLLALVWMLAGILVLSPGLTAVVAGIFGIGRGTDLVLYVFIILAFLYAMFTYYRLCDIRKDITLIVRHIAITEHQIPAEKERVESKESDALQKHEGQPKVKNKCTEPE